MSELKSLSNVNLSNKDIKLTKVNPLLFTALSRVKKSNPTI